MKDQPVAKDSLEEALKINNIEHQVESLSKELEAVSSELESICNVIAEIKKDFTTASLSNLETSFALKEKLIELTNLANSNSQKIKDLQTLLLTNKKEESWDLGSLFEFSGVKAIVIIVLVLFFGIGLTIAGILVGVGKVLGWF